MQIFRFSLLKLKFIKFLSFFKQKVSFSLNFGSLFSAMRHISSVQKFGQNKPIKRLDCSRKISANFYFDRFLKVYEFLAKKYRWVISHDREDWCKIWRKTDPLFQKWQEFGEIWPEHSKVSKTCTFICSYCAKYIMFDQKITEELSFMTLKGDAKFEQKLTCGLENDMRNMKNFHQSTWKSQNLDFHGILSSKVEKV